MRHPLAMLLATASIAAALATTTQSAERYLFGRPLEYELIHSDSGISRPPLADIHSAFAKLHLEHSSTTEWIEYGRSGQNKPLMALRIMNRDVSTKRRPAVFISEAIHGNEYLHITDRLPIEFLAKTNPAPEFNRFIENGGVVYFVPIMNPDGYSAGQRGNAAGADLNRDFKIQAAGNQGFRQPETRAVTNFVTSEAQSLQLTVEATMEYHCCIGGLIHPWAWTSEGLTGDALTRHQEFGELVKDIFNYPYGTVSDILGYSAVGGSDDYYLETYGRRAFSFEGQRSVESRRLADHIRLWDRFFATLN